MIAKIGSVLMGLIALGTLLSIPGAIEDIHARAGGNQQQELARVGSYIGTVLVAVIFGIVPGYLAYALWVDPESRRQSPPERRG